MLKYLARVISGGTSVMQEHITIHDSSYTISNGMHSFYGPGKIGRHTCDGYKEVVYKTNSIMISYPINMTIISTEED